jgi:hypothetical protein
MGEISAAAGWWVQMGRIPAFVIGQDWSPAEREAADLDFVVIIE